jgi:glycosyltransferase involved in cell wall biosynthesis
MQEILLSVVICAHNPRREYLERTLESLRAQDLPTIHWELMIVDNGSEIPISSYLDLSWQARGRIVVEKRTGLTPARICGIRHTTGPVILFVDDDNILASDYLTNVLAIEREYPQLAVWGAAKIEPEYEKAPHAEVEPFCAILALRDIGRDAWSNLPILTEYLPVGAGMVLRRKLAEDYTLHKEQSRFNLGRTGTSLLSSEDYEIALLAADRARGSGVFERLRLTHLIPARRVEREYLLRLHEAVAQSNVLVVLLHEKKHEGGKLDPAYVVRQLVPPLGKMILHGGFARSIHFRVLRGRWKALRTFRNMASALQAVPASPVA